MSWIASGIQGLQEIDKNEMFAMVEILPFENTWEPDRMAKTHQTRHEYSPLPVCQQAEGQSDRSLLSQGDNTAATEALW